MLQDILLDRYLVIAVINTDYIYCGRRQLNLYLHNTSKVNTLMMI